MTLRDPHSIGRAARVDPPNRFERVRVEADREHGAAAGDAAPDRAPTELLPDRSRTIIAENNSPDVGFRYSVNAYRGCEHGCAYCYARPTHELLGMNAGLDFEAKILVKYDAPKLLRAELARPKWRGELIAMSGVTDCYQPIERRLQLTRGLLEVMRDAGQCTGIVTKNLLVTRDVDLLGPMAARRLAHAYISVTTLDDQLARTMEPRTSLPRQRLEAIRALADAGVPTGVLVAPVIPGLNDHEVPQILAAARDSGARAASYILLRLPLAVRPVFETWLDANYPDAAERVRSRIRATRAGALTDSRFGARMRGEGRYAEQIQQTFRLFRRKLGLDQPLPDLDTTQFRPPERTPGQGRLFD